MTDYQLIGIVLVCVATMLSIFKYLDFIQENKSWNYLYSGFIKIGYGENPLPKIGHTVLVIIHNQVTNQYRYKLAAIDESDKWCKPFMSEEELPLDNERVIAWAPLDDPFDGTYP